MQIGHDEAYAKEICEGIQDRAEKGTLFKALPPLEILKGHDGDLVVGGYASWEIIDAEGDFVTTEAMVNYLAKFFNLPPEYRNISIDHTNFQIGTALLHYPDDEPQYFSHVHEKGMYLIAKIRNDALKRTQHYRDLIRKGEYKMYSISGEAIRRETVVEDNTSFRKIYDIDPFETAIVKEGMNAKAGPLTILKSPCPPCVEHLRDKYMAKGFDEHVATDMAVKLVNRVSERMHHEDTVIQKPFADYANWEECMADCHANHPDVSDCEKWCGHIKHQTEGKAQQKPPLSVIHEAERIFRKHFPNYTQQR